MAAACGEPGVVAGHAPHEPWYAPAEVAFAPAPELTPGMFPCSDCHAPDLPFDPARRELDLAHGDLRLVHGEHMWCFDCHDGEQRDKLKSVGGRLVGYDESHELCGQCHSPQVRDWRRGVHGRRTGNFANGTAQALRCAHCHDAHAPRMKAVEAMSGPERPTRNR